jgi:5'-3' exoribonuclease 1
MNYIIYMGIPKYFKHITKKYPDVILNIDNKVKIDNLYFDMNCLIHPCTRNVTKANKNLVILHNKAEKLQKYKTDPSYHTELEKRIYKEIAEYIDKLVNVVNPSLIYMAIDGVAPRAKMEQQRTRRYRSIKIKELEDVVYKKYNIDNITFDTNCITPGTIFMYKLAIFLKKYISERHNENNINYILDDCQNKGEGEHKILQYIKKHTLEDTNCIYGLDADLIMLALCCGSKIYLLREEIYFGKVDTNSFLYLDIELLGDNLYEEIYSMVDPNIFDGGNEITRQEIINDYICLCFLIGNDFLPHLNGIDILTNSINDLLKIYVKILSIRHKTLVEKGSINFIFLRQIITFMFSNEDKYLAKYQSKIDKFRPRMEYNNSMELELEKVKYYPVFNKESHFKLGKDSWLDLYYNYYFNIKNTIHQRHNIDEICGNYIDGLQWNIKYYLDTCPSDTWYYRYSAGPCIRELTRYLISRVYPTQFDSTTEFTPFEQLAIVLPIQSSHLWADNYRTKLNDDMYLASFYPIDFKLDKQNNNFLYQCDPILMDINDSYIKEVFANTKLTEFEQLRNKISGLYLKGIDKENLKIEIE